LNRKLQSKRLTKIYSLLKKKKNYFEKKNNNKKNINKKSKSRCN